MRFAATGLALLLAIVVGLVAIPAVSGLEDTGQGLPGAVGTLWGSMTGYFLFVVAAIAIGTVVAAVAILLRR